jgi:hypothetical protein
MGISIGFDTAKTVYSTSGNALVQQDEKQKAQPEIRAGQKHRDTGFI